MIYNEIENSITAEKGKILTDGSGVFTGKVYLGKNDKAENWQEITDEEYGKIIKENERE